MAAWCAVCPRKQVEDKRCCGRYENNCTADEQDLKE